MIMLMIKSFNAASNELGQTLMQPEAIFQPLQHVFANDSICEIRFIILPCQREISDNVVWQKTYITHMRGNDQTPTTQELIFDKVA